MGIFTTSKTKFETTNCHCNDKVVAKILVSQFFPEKLLNNSQDTLKFNWFPCFFSRFQCFKMRRLLIKVFLRWKLPDLELQASFSPSALPSSNNDEHRLRGNRRSSTDSEAVQNLHPETGGRRPAGCDQDTRRSPPHRAQFA